MLLARRISCPSGQNLPRRPAGVRSRMQEPAHQSGLDRRVAVVRRWTRDVARAQRPAWPPDSRRSGPTRLCPAFAHDRTPLFPFAPSRPKVPGVGPSLRCGARRCICSNVSCGSRESNGLVVVSAPLGAYFVGNGARGPSAISAGALVRHGRRGAGYPDGRASASRARPTVMCAPPQRCLPLSHARVLLPSRRRARVLRAGARRP